MKDFKTGVKTFGALMTRIIGAVFSVVMILCMYASIGLFNASDILDPWSERNTTVESESVEE